MKMRLRLMPINRIPDGSQFYLYGGRQLYTLVTRNLKTDEAVYHRGRRETPVPGGKRLRRFHAPMYSGTRWERDVWLVVSPGTSAP